MHRKQNKACKFCKAHAQFQEQKTAELEARRSAALARIREDRSGSREMNIDDKVPLPNLVYFPQLLKEWILGNKYYNQVFATQEYSEVKQALFNCDTCELEVRDQISLDTVPSTFFCTVYRMLMIKLTEGQLRGLLNNRSRWVRCAGFMYVRMGMHSDRYWELLSDALMDHEDFVPFPGRGNERMSEGQFVEQLLTKEKYCDVTLPRIATAQRRTINERLVLYEQFRKRYEKNLEALDRLDAPDGGIDVEVCGVDGEWQSARTIARPTVGRRRVTVPVRLKSSGEEEHISIGMVIMPSRDSSSSHDLTRSRGKSKQELLEKYREQQRDAAVATGRDYCKTSGRHTVHAGGATFICGEKRGRRADGEEDEEEKSREAKKQQRPSEPSQEHQQRMAAIMEKYCSSKGRRGAGAPADAPTNIEGPDRMRLG